MKIKILLFTVVAGWLSISSVIVAQETVHNYTSEKGKLSVNFPTEFTDREVDTETYTFYEASAKMDGMLFRVNARVNQMDDELLRYMEENKSDLFDARINEFVNNVKGELINSVDARNKGIEGKIAIITMGKNKVFYSIYLKGQVEYQLLVVELAEGSLDDKMVNSFKNSLEIF